MRADQHLEYRMHWERVFWQRSEVCVAVMLNAGCEDEEGDAEHCL